MCMLNPSNLIQPFSCNGCRNKCKEKGILGPYEGYIKVYPSPGYTALKECPRHKEYSKNQILNRQYYASNLVSKYTFDDFKGTDPSSVNSLNFIRDIAEHFHDHGYDKDKLFYLCGKNGTMKTSMARALGRELIKKGYTCQYILFADFINLVVKDFNSNNLEQKEALLKRCTDCDLLIIDEAFDKTKGVIYKSGYQIPFIDDFLRSRLDIEHKSTFFVSNADPNDIQASGFGTSLQDFVHRNVKFTTLYFNEKYEDVANEIDPYALFGPREAR